MTSSPFTPVMARFRPLPSAAVLLSCAFAVLGAAPPAAGAEHQALTREAVLAEVQRVADWELAHPYDGPLLKTHPVGFGETSWRRGVLFMAIGELAERTGEPRYRDALIAWGEANAWKPGVRGWHADDQAVLHAYLTAHELTGDPAPLAGALAAAALSVTRSAGPDAEEPWLWHWSDALFMAAPAYAALSRITGDPAWAGFLAEEYAETVDRLYDADERLFFRDDRFPGMLDADGGKIFWGRGNGWAFAATALVLDELPPDDPRRPAYEQILVEMAARLVELQQPDGFWKASLLNPDAFPDGESSATGFFVYGLAWGVRNGLLDDAAYRPSIDAGWAALRGAVNPAGRLGYVQPGGDRPARVPAEHHEPYGAAAFVLAGLEVAALGE